MQSEFGHTKNGELVHRIELRRDQLTVGILTYGAAIHSLQFPDKTGHMADLVLGYDTVEEYERNGPYLGVIVGRVAGRVRDAKFCVPADCTSSGDVCLCHLPQNNGTSCLHGGERGLSRHVWKIKNVQSAERPSVTLHLTSPDGDEGFPGELQVSVTYTLEEHNRLRLEYEAKVGSTCPLNLTNHAYFNLAGEGAKDVYDHEVLIHGDKTLQLGEDLLPTGALVPLKTPLNVAPVPLTRELLHSTGVSPPFGFDGYVVFEEQGLYHCQATVYHPNSGRSLSLFTDQPGVQFYTGNFLDGEHGKSGHIYNQHSALCLEAQGFPDAVNHPEFPSVWVRPGQVYRQITEYQLAVHQ